MAAIQAMLLCRYDTVHGKFNGKVEASDKGLIVEGHTIVFHQCKNPGGCSPTVVVGCPQGLPSAAASVGCAIFVDRGAEQITLLHAEQ